MHPPKTRRQPRRARLATLPTVIALAAAMLSACTSSAGKDPTVGRSGDSATVTIGETPTPGPTGAHRGGTLTVAVSASAQENLDAISPADSLDQVRAQLVYERMASVDRDFQIQPILYSSATHNTDGSKWTFTIKSHAAFADGTPVRGSDVLATLAADVAAGKDSVQTLLVIDQKKSTAEGKTIHFVLSQPVANLPMRFAQSFFVVLPDGKGSQHAAAMNGSGPYHVTSFVPGQRTVLERRANYWGGDSRGAANKIVLLGVADPAARMRALESGQVDMATDISLPLAAANEHGSKIKLHKSRALQGMDLILNATIAPFDDVRVRQAFRLAIDRKQLAETALSGIGKPGNDVWGAGYPGYDDELPQRSRDVAKAKGLLRQAGHEHVSLTVRVPKDGGALTRGTLLIAEQVKAAGFDVTVRQLTRAQYNQAHKWTSWPAVGFAMGWPFQTMAAFFYTPTAFFNFGWHNARWDTTYDKALATFDQTERQRLLDTLQQQLWHAGPDVIWGLAPVVLATSATLTGADDVANFNYPDLTNVGVR